jgi:plastocyanin
MEVPAMKRFPTGLVAGAFLVMVIAACGSPGGGGTAAPASSPSSAPAAATITVVPDPTTIGTFMPPAVSVKTGDTVTWSFEDLNPHTASSDMGVFSSLPLTKGKTYAYRFAKAGTYKYHCAIHPEMMGTITVS